MTKTAKIIGLLLIILALISNEWVLGKFFSHGGISDVFFRITIIIVELTILFLGIVLFRAKTKEDWFKAVFQFFVFWIIVLGILSAAEFVFLLREPHRTPIAQKYQPFAVQHLHPFYYFFFPQSEREIAAINNDVVSITTQGFRGPGPEQKGDRKLAFFLGGSAAFGFGNSSNETTIPGYLNQFQAEYFFVNAGVPSWNSTQEFYRLALESLSYHPDLIVVYDGFNDAISSYDYEKGGYNFPPGTVESYGSLQKWVDDIREARIFQIDFIRLAHSFFPRLRKFLNESLQTKDIPIVTRVPGGSLFDPKPSAEVYLRNLELMKKLCASYRIKFIALWQPILFQHKADSLSGQGFSQPDSGSVEYVREFHTEVLKQIPSDLSFYDYGNIFDRVDREVPLNKIFLDQAHLSDLGNEMVARKIAQELDSLFH